MNEEDPKETEQIKEQLKKRSFGRQTIILDDMINVMESNVVGQTSGNVQNNQMSSNNMMNLQPQNNQMQSNNMMNSQPQTNQMNLGGMNSMLGNMNTLQNNQPANIQQQQKLKKY